VEKEYNEYSERVKENIKKYAPGLSGIGSIVFRNEEEILQTFYSHEAKDRFYYDVIMPYKGELEVWYSQHRDVFTYFRLIIMTVQAVIRGGSSWKKLKGIPSVPKELEEYL
jgi:lipopolysaccharide/colanic/teichoic acid biosynthesis glycosyltransferase